MPRAVLGKITDSADRPRGSDVELSITVPEQWITSGSTLELELPRNLRCAACSGGGCDACERSGAVSLRGRKEPPELVEVTLPRGHSHLVLRVPERGGFPPAGSDLPRGNLLLTVAPGPAPERGVVRLQGPSIPPPRIPEMLQSSPPSTRHAARLWVAAGIALLVLIWLLARVLSRSGGP